MWSICKRFKVLYMTLKFKNLTINLLDFSSTMVNIYSVNPLWSAHCTLYPDFLVLFDRILSRPEWWTCNIHYVFSPHFVFADFIVIVIFPWQGLQGIPGERGPRGETDDAFDGTPGPPGIDGFKGEKVERFPLSSSFLYVQWFYVCALKVTIIN